MSTYPNTPEGLSAAIAEANGAAVWFDGPLIRLVDTSHDPGAASSVSAAVKVSGDIELMVGGVEKGTAVSVVEFANLVVDGDWTPAIQAALSAAKCVTFAGQSSYTVKSPIFVGFAHRMDLAGATITMLTDNVPVFVVTSSRWRIEGGQIAYANQQPPANSNAYGILLSNAFEGIMRNLMITRGMRGVGINKYGTWDGQAYAYMILCKNVRCLDSSDYSFYFSNNGFIGLTTNVFIGCYALQSANNNANTASKGFMLSFHTGGVTLIGCAADKLQGGKAIISNGNTCLTVIGFDAESCKTSQSELIVISASTGVYLDFALYENYFYGTFASIVRVTGKNRNVKIRGREMSSHSTVTEFYGLLVDDVQLEDTTVDAYEYVVDGGWLKYDGLTPNGKRTVLGYNMQMGAERIGLGRVREYRSTPPTAGTWQIGDVATNYIPSSVSPVMEWTCVASGTPGAWRPVSWITARGTTAARPPLTASDIGVMYLDTTLAAAGKPIAWTGTAWVDATGATV